MGTLVTVTVETDGHRDYVRMPSGQRYILGTTSVLKLLSALVSDRLMFRHAIEEFNAKGHAVVALDPEAMLEMLAPKITRRAGLASPFMGHQDRTSFTTLEGKDMSVQRLLELRLSHLEHTVREMNSRVASGGPVPASWQRNLHQAAIELPDFGDQSKNQAFYGLGEPEVDTMEEGWMPPAEVTHPMGKSAAVLNSNSALAEKVLTKLAATSDKIDALQAAGRPFNAAKAQRDLHKIASEVQLLLANADLSEPGVRNDLVAVAKKASYMHDLFASARV